MYLLVYCLLDEVEVLRIVSDLDLFDKNYNEGEDLFFDVLFKEGFVVMIVMSVV